MEPFLIQWLRDPPDAQGGLVNDESLLFMAANEVCNFTGSR